MSLYKSIAISLIIFISLWYICCILYRHGTFGTPTINPVGSIWCFCKKKLPPKAILLHFLSPYEITLALLHDCMFVYVRLKSQVVVNYGQKISVNFNICFLVKVKRYLKCYNKRYFVKIFEPYYLSKINIMRYQKSFIKM